MEAQLTANSPDSLADFLVRVRVEKIAEVAERRLSTPLDSLTAMIDQMSASDPPRGFARALSGDGISVIAEIKLKSPSAGWICEGADVEEIARGYSGGGAAALSVLTDETHFGGSLRNIALARDGAPTLPALRKDFIVDEYQVHEARANGADAVLLIVAMLEEDELSRLAACADSLGMDALVEIHAEDELDRALAVSPGLVGINNRDLRSMTVDLATFERLAMRVPAGCVAVCESGVKTRADVERVEAAGAKAVLVGQSLMESPDPAAKLRELLGR